MTGTYLCSGWESAQALVNLANNFPEGVLVKFGVFPQCTHRCVRAFLHQASHHVVPALQPPILPA